ncbi:MAG: hypothetical protein H6825_08780 [Planctomycetes bacterium]|nr:hypothetical protein [Planctomycetota bacterium]
MIALPAVAAAVLLARLLLAGSDIDLGPAACVSAPSVLALAVGLGLVLRARRPTLVPTLGIALLVPARGLLVDLSAALWPLSQGGTTLAALLSLAPVGFLLGRALAPLIDDGVVPAVLGWMLGEILAYVGAVGRMPGELSGFSVAVLLAALVELHERRRAPSAPQGAESDERDAPAWEALPPAAAFALLFVCVRRIAPAYAEPGAQPGVSLTLAFLAQALVVLLPVRVLASGTTARRVLFAAGCLALGVALWLTSGNLDVWRVPMLKQQVTWTMHNHVWAHLGLLDAWWAWLLFLFVGYGAAGLGLLLGALRRGAAGPLLIGLGLGLVAESLVDVEPLAAPRHLLLAGVGVACVSALGAWRPRAAFAAPLGVAFVLVPLDSPPDFAAITRVGEPTSEGFVRRLPADVVVSCAFGPDTSVRDSRRCYADTFTRRVHVSARDEIERLAEQWTSEDTARPEPGEFVRRPGALAGDDDGADAPADVDPFDLRAEDALAARHYGLRVAGAAASPGHDPLGVEGALGRLDRLFGVRGPAAVTGTAGELAAADLVDAGLCRPDEIVLASAAPLTLEMTRVLLADYGSAGYLGLADGDPAGWLRARAPQSCATFVVAPERGAWPASGAALAVESLRRARETLRPDGRCLIWIDTGELDARALRARLAAAGAVFGERAACFVEMRGLDAPWLLVLGWRDDAGRPRAADVSLELPWPEASGVRTRLRDLDDLAAMLLLDGPGLLSLADDGPVHRRGRPVPSDAIAPTGWSAVAALLPELPPARLDRALDGAPPTSVPLEPVASALAAHASYSFHLSLVRGSEILEIVPDIDWDAFEREVDAWAAAAASVPGHPLLHVGLATLLETLAVEGDYSRFAAVWQRVDGDRLESWRLAVLKAKVLRQMLEPEQAWDSLDRARELAGLPPR